MGDPHGPWQDYGGRTGPDTPAPRHVMPGDAHGRHVRDRRVDDPPDGGGGGPGTALRRAAAGLAWRYESSPLWVRVTTDIVAASVVLVLIVGLALALRSDGHQQASAGDGPAPSTTGGTVPTTLATTTTTAPPTTTTVPATTTTVATTTTTAPPATAPPTAPPTTPATTTTTEDTSFRSCRSAWLAGALPLVEGDPGYGPHLDRDGDGEACERDERRG